MPPDHIWFDALCAYHDQAAEHEEALKARDAELALLRNKGRWAAESRCRVERCRLRARLGLEVAEELAAARAVIGRLRKPDALLMELDRIAFAS
jgi:hypothetical protein